MISEYEVGVEVYVCSTGKDNLVWNAWNERGDSEEDVLLIRMMTITRSVLNLRSSFCSDWGARSLA